MSPRRRARLLLPALAAALLLGMASAPASAVDVSPMVMSCLQRVLGAEARELLAGGEKALARMSPQKAGLASACLLTEGRRAGKASRRPPSLTVSPIEPGVVTSMSRFRSCAGHDFSGQNVQGQAERGRSMKNYLYVDAPWTATGSVPVRAPFSGTAIVSVEEEYPLGSWVRVLHPGGWVFTVFHADPSIRDGQKVKAGEQIAVFPPANAPTFMPERMGEPEANFDFSLQSTDGRIAPFLDSLTPSARQAWEARGFTPKALTISKAERDAQPCARDYPDGPGSSGFVAATAG